MTKPAPGPARKTPKSPAKAPAKTAAKAAVKTAVKTVARPAPKAAARTPSPVPGKAVQAMEPSMRFHHSKALRAKTHTVLEALEAEPDHPRHGDAMADLVTELIEAGMDYYFMRALRQAQVGFVAEQSARIGISGAVKLISSVNRKFILRMDKDQLLVVARHIRELG
jgi:hypothetical protein